MPSDIILKSRSGFVSALLALGLSTHPAFSEVVLFDGSLGTLPATQGWLYFADPVGSHSVTQVASPGFTTLDTLDPITNRGGYFSRDPLWGILAHPAMPVLSRSLGFSINFTLRVVTERHVTGPAGDDNGDGLDDRAGFSVIAIASDRLGLELSFWEDSVWVQNDDAQGTIHLFTQAEGASIDTSTIFRDYRLEVLNDRYRLAAGPGIRRVLAGRVRDYRNFTGGLDPYEIPNLLFLGDNTTRGESVTQLARVAVGGIPPRCTEIDALVQRVATGTYEPGYDLDMDGSLTLADVTRWLEEAGNFYLGGGQVFLPGDANLDGVVNGHDFDIWAAHKFTAGPSWCQGDFNADGVKDGQDYGLWNQHRQPSLLVPEPPFGSVLGPAAMMLFIEYLKRRAR